MNGHSKMARPQSQLSGTVPGIVSGLRCYSFQTGNIPSSVEYFSFQRRILFKQLLETISKEYKDWKEDMSWFTGYFTLGSWSSMGLLLWCCNNKII